jgi:hypothetical protein
MCRTSVGIVCHQCPSLTRPSITCGVITCHCLPSLSRPSITCSVITCHCLPSSSRPSIRCLHLSLFAITIPPINHTFVMPVTVRRPFPLVLLIVPDVCPLSFGLMLTVLGPHILCNYGRWQIYLAMKRCDREQVRYWKGKRMVYNHVFST